MLSNGGVVVEMHEQLGAVHTDDGDTEVIIWSGEFVVKGVHHRDAAVDQDPVFMFTDEGQGFVHGDVLCVCPIMDVDEVVGGGVIDCFLYRLPCMLAWLVDGETAVDAVVKNEDVLWFRHRVGRIRIIGDGQGHGVQVAGGVMMRWILKIRGGVIPEIPCSVHDGAIDVRGGVGEIDLLIDMGDSRGTREVGMRYVVDYGDVDERGGSLALVVDDSQIHGIDAGVSESMGRVLWSGSWSS